MDFEPAVAKNMVVEFKGATYNINSSDIVDFLQACETFMSIHGNDFEIMIQTISDTIIDNSNPEMTMGVLGPQLKFLREVGYLLSGLVSNIE
ncbi:hypothetical protein ACFQZX_11570 [Mucilaginibacter litoreus]|uniref:Uncharacterized protein n=2 Tax=Mucilaginibacter litoreus TaxID=1048221 RepID=A0ABW3AT75_9SPHI